MVCLVGRRKLRLPTIASLKCRNLSTLLFGFPRELKAAVSREADEPTALASQCPPVADEGEEFGVADDLRHGGSTSGATV